MHVCNKCSVYTQDIHIHKYYTHIHILIVSLAKLMAAVKLGIAQLCIHDCQMNEEMLHAQMHHACMHATHTCNTCMHEIYTCNTCM